MTYAKIGQPIRHHCFTGLIHDCDYRTGRVCSNFEQRKSPVTECRKEIMSVKMTQNKKPNIAIWVHKMF